MLVVVSVLRETQDVHVKLVENVQLVKSAWISLVIQAHVLVKQEIPQPDVNV